MIGIIGVGIAAYLPVSSEGTRGSSADRGELSLVVVHLLKKLLHMSKFI